jgi:glycosyltransferase involved in cell wall biosynthesis
MITGRDIIVTSLQSWDLAIGGNCKNIALEFAKDNRVLFVNSPLDRATIWRKSQEPQIRKRIDINKGKSASLVQEGKNLWVLYPRTVLESIGRIPWNWIFDRLNGVNNRRFANQILKATRQLEFKDPILFNDSNIFRGFYLRELISPSLSVYYSRDNLMAIDFWKRHGSRLEPILMQKSDIVISNSDYLRNIAKQYNSRSISVGQGCDISIYDRKKIKIVPADIASIPSPIIGYTGVVFSLRLDPDLIRFVAKQYPKWNFVLIGPEDEDFKTSDLHEYNNIYFLGSKHPDQLPEYINRFDVAINPQKLNALTVGNYPRKIDEYLAMGKPVVALKTEAMSFFAEHTYLATNKEEFGKQIETALFENTAEKERIREEFAHSHSWENNVQDIYTAMEMAMDTRNDTYGFSELKGKLSVNTLKY